MSTHQRRQINLVEIPNVKTSLGERSVLYQGLKKLKHILRTTNATYTQGIHTASLGLRPGGGAGTLPSVRRDPCLGTGYITVHYQEVVEDIWALCSVILAPALGCGRGGGGVRQHVAVRIACTVHRHITAYKGGSRRHAANSIIMAALGCRRGCQGDSIMWVSVFRPARRVIRRSK